MPNSYHCLKKGDLTLPIRLKPIDDELLFSLINRTAYANGFHSADFLYEKMVQSTDLGRLSYDGRDNYLIVSNLIGKVQKDLPQFLMQHSVFNGISPFLPYYKQIKIIRIMAGLLSRKTMKPLFTRLRYCPVCIKVSIEKYGMPVWYCSHQIPGVTVCYIHGCRLYEYHGKYGEEMNFSSGWKMAGDDRISKDDIHYAAIAHELLQHQYGITFEDAREAISSALQTAKDRISGKYENIISRFNYSGALATPEECIGLIAELYDSADDFLPTIRAGRQDGDDYITALANASEYEFIEPSDKKVQRDEKLFAREVRDLTGSHYQVMVFNPGKKTTATVRHTDCGREMNYPVTRFLLGCRCPDCRRKLSETDIRQFISVNSDSRYKYIGRAMGNTILIKDTIQESIKVMTTELAFQELSRPTPSLLLPHNTVQSQVSVTNRREMLFDRLRQMYGANDLIFTDDFQEDPECGYIILTIKEFAKQHKLDHIAYGIYSWPGSRFSAMDVIAQKYMARGGKTFGYITGKSFAYSLGLLKSAPQILTIITTGINGDYAASILGIKCNIGGSRIPVTDQNAHLLPVLDLFAKFERYHTCQSEEAFILLRKYIKTNQIDRNDFEPCIGLYQPRVQKRIELLFQSHLT